MISTSIKLDGEAEFKKQLSSVNGELKNLNSDMKLVTEQFKGQANSLDALTAKDRILTDQVEQQTEKVRALEQALQETSNAYGENDKRVDGYYQSLNRAKAELAKMQRELQDNSRYLDEARRSADRAATSIDGFGREVAQVEDETAGFKNTLGGSVGDLGKLKGAIIGGAAVGALKELGGAILEVEENTREYRQIMSSLAASGEAAGIAAEDTAARYQLLNGVMNDTQAAAEATAQLQTLQATEEQLDEATIAVIGSWSKLGGAAPIETIAESISQTVAAGQATGAFSDILMATGQSEDEFNAKLAESADASERLDLVLQTLANVGMKDLGESYLETNAAAIQANQTQDRLNASWAALGETLAPVADLIRNGLATALDFATEKVDAAIVAVQELSEWWGATKRSLEEMSNWSLGDLWDALTTVPGLETQAQAASVTGGLTGAELREKNLRATDIVSASQAAARNATYAVDAMANRGSFSATITLATEDGRNLGQYLTPFVNEENAANPPVRSDPL